VRAQRGANQPRGRGLDMHGVDRDQQPNIPEQPKKLSHTGDLVALLGGGELAEHRSRMVGEQRHQMRGGRAHAPRAAQRLAVHRDRQQPGLLGGQGGE
jgi:hypothetical protein